LLFRRLRRRPRSFLPHSWTLGAEKPDAPPAPIELVSQDAPLMLIADATHDSFVSVSAAPHCRTQ
jgi:hypothetical protein